MQDHSRGLDVPHIHTGDSTRYDKGMIPGYTGLSARHSTESLTVAGLDFYLISQFNYKFCALVQVEQCDTDQGAVMLCSWETSKSVSLTLHWPCIVDLVDNFYTDSVCLTGR